MYNGRFPWCALAHNILLIYSECDSQDGSRQNEGPSKSTLGNVNATRAEGSAYPVLFEVVASRKDTESKYSRVCSKKAVFGYIDTSVALQKG